VTIYKPVHRLEYQSGRQATTDNFLGVVCITIVVANVLCFFILAQEPRYVVISRQMVLFHCPMLSDFYVVALPLQNNPFASELSWLLEFSADLMLDSNVSNNSPVCLGQASIFSVMSAAPENSVLLRISPIKVNRCALIVITRVMRLRTDNV
jgi:hypothetical protein